MEKVKSKLPTWDQTKTTSKKGFDKVWGWADKLGAPINRFSNRIGSEAFWPTTLDKESDKAARILRSFCKDGFYTEAEPPATTPPAGPKQKQRVLKKIPQSVIQNAVGLAIFTTMRTGLWVSGAGGSGVLVARTKDGSWSPPSGIMLHTAGLGFLVGVDIYDCVLVINNPKALEAFTKIRATLGGEISAVAGPVGAGGVLENDGKWKEANRPVFTYLKSRGFYAGVQVDGTVVIERSDENARFYGEPGIKVADILAGKARHPPRQEIKMLMETLKAAEGRTDVDSEVMDELRDQPAPSDVDLDAPGGEGTTTFGIPDPEDPDPFGVLALEKEGLAIVDAETHSRPSSGQFEFHPSPKSPVYKIYRRSTGASRTRSTSNPGTSGRWSTGSYATSEAGTQTDPVLVTPLQADHSPLPNGVHGDSVRADDQSVYEDAAGTNSRASHELDTPTNGNPWTSENFTDNGTRLNGTAIGALSPLVSGGATEGANGASLASLNPRRVPPPLPPRDLGPPPIQEFEDVSLVDTDRKDPSPEGWKTT